MKNNHFLYFAKHVFKLVCGLCVAGEHKPHSWVPLEEGTESAKELLKEAIVPIQTRITQAEEEMITIQRKNKALQEEIKKNEERIKETKQKNR